MTSYDIASQPIQGILEAYFKIKRQWLARKRIHYSCADGIEKPVPDMITIASLVMPNGDLRDR